MSFDPAKIFPSTLLISSKKEVKVLVVYHSAGGTTKRTAEAIGEGLSVVENVTVDVWSVEEATKKIKEVANYDAYLFGGPTYFGSLSAGLKAFLEATTIYFIGRQLQDKVCGGFTNSASQSGDKALTLQDISAYAFQQGMIWVPLGALPINNRSTRNEDAYNRAGYFAGVATQSYHDVKPELNPPESDLRTARHFGTRFANVCLQYYK